MKILKFTAENVKRLEAVEITPSGDVQIIGGDNSNGKTSVLDAIWLALGGGDASKLVKTPVRQGQDSASVTLDLGEYIVTREWKNDKTKLTVAAASGAKFETPQKLLDSLLGEHTFDPLAFIRLEPKKQLETLLALVHLDINLEANKAAEKNAYDARTEVNREVDTYAKQLGALGEEIEDAPKEFLSIGDLVSNLEGLQLKQEAWRHRAELLDRLDFEILEMQQKLNKKIEERGILLENPLEFVEDLAIASLKNQIDSVEETNNKIRRNNEKLALAEKWADAKSRSEKLSATLKALETEKSDALANAKFPVPGLGFTEDGVTYNDLPLADASESEKIRVSLGMAMALNPKIRVIRINDGSLLDKKNLALITQMAKEKDFQIWVETIGDNGVGVIIEDGKVLKDYSKSPDGKIPN